MSLSKHSLSPMPSMRFSEKSSRASGFLRHSPESPLRGQRVFGEADKGSVDEHTILRLFSCTKLVTTIACLQSTDQGRVSLHDPEVIAQYLPELGELQILHGYEENVKEILSKPKARITFNMLLTHTSGFTYPYFSPTLTRWCREHDIPPLSAPHVPLSAFLTPLVCEPGTQYAYGHSVDWAGFLASRVAGMPLEEYFQKHIFQPAGMSDTSFLPPSDYATRQMAIVTRPVAFPLGPPLTPKEVGTNYAGGHGLYAFRVLFTDTIPDGHPPSIQRDLATMAKNPDVYDPAWTASGKGEDLGHSPGLFLSSVGSKFGRSAGSGCWWGLANTMYWLDPSKGVAGICFTNLRTAGADPWDKVYNDFERLVYDHLEQA